MEDVEERRRRLAAMREQADAQIRDDDGTASSTPSLSAPLLTNPLEDSSADNVASAEVKKNSSFDFYTDPLAGYSGSKRRRPGVGVLPTPGQAPLSGNASRHGSTGLLPPPPHLQAGGLYRPPGSPSWQPIVYQPLHSNPGIAHPNTPSGFQPVGYQTPYANPILSYPQPLVHPHVQFQPQFPPHPVNQWSNQKSGRGRGRGSDRGFGGRYSGRQSPKSSAGNSWMDGRTSEGRGAHGKGQGVGRFLSAKEDPDMFVTKKMMEAMLEDPWQALEAERKEKDSNRDGW